GVAEHRAAVAVLSRVAGGRIEPREAPGLEVHLVRAWRERHAAGEAGGAERERRVVEHADGAGAALRDGGEALEVGVVDPHRAVVELEAADREVLVPRSRQRAASRARGLPRHRRAEVVGLADYQAALEPRGVRSEGRADRVVDQ